MTKNEFLESLRNALSEMDEEDRAKQLEYYSEMIDDRIEDGCTEEEAISALGSIYDIKKTIFAEMPLLKKVKTNIKPKKKMRAWQKVLLIISAPIWGSLFFAFACVAFALLIVVWALVISLYAVTFSLAISSIAMLASSPILLMNANAVQAVIIFGAALIVAGIALLSFIISFFATKGAVNLGKAMIKLIK